jgi:predicted RNA-binding protein with PUA-like domain
MSERNYWLMKSEPEVYSIDDLRRDRKTQWDGVRNFKARNYMRDEMKVGDGVLFYHSNAEPKGVFGIARVAKLAHPDQRQFDPKSDYYDPAAAPEAPRWWGVDVEFVEKFEQPVTLEQMRAHSGLTGMALLKRGQRLSVQRVTPKEWRLICTLGKARSER